MEFHSIKRIIIQIIFYFSNLILFLKNFPYDLFKIFASENYFTTYFLIFQSALFTYVRFSLTHNLFPKVQIPLSTIKSEKDEIPWIKLSSWRKPLGSIISKNNRHEFGHGRANLVKSWKLRNVNRGSRESRRRGTVNSENSIRSV